MSIKDLKHVVRPLSNSGFVMILDTGGVIGPESAAMLQALHSRSVGGIKEHLKALTEKGSGAFMKKYYIGYNHKSIGDCGDAIVFIEGVPMFVPKSVQDWPLYSGQESSTRFIDFAKQIFANPLGTVASEELLEKLRKFYLYGIKELNKSLKLRFPIKEGEKSTIYDKTISARAFDIMRGFLPAGAHTNLSWMMNLRQFADELLTLRHHPLNIVREVSMATEDGLMEMFPNSFSKKRYEAIEKYAGEMGRLHTYHHRTSLSDFEVSKVLLDFDLLSEYKQAIITRPEKAELPRKIRECGLVRFEFPLDFGSFRDIQRHRAVTQQMPLLTTDLGFNQWYLSELRESMDDLYSQACEVCDFICKKLARFDCPPEILQYYIPMGFNTANRLTGDLHALTYLIELRSGWAVHPTLRKKAIQMGEALSTIIAPYFDFALHLDTSKTQFDFRRGSQDIIEK